MREVSEDIRRRARRFFDGWFRPDLRLIFLRNSTPDILEHEFNHYMLQAATPFGHMIRALSDTSKLLAIDYCKARLARGSGRRVAVPIYNVANILQSSENKEMLTDHEYLPSLKDIEQFIEPWADQMVLYSILDGGDSIAATETPMIEAIELHKNFEHDWYKRNTLPSSSLNLLSIRSKDLVQMACPIYGKEIGRPVGIGAAQILESMATLIEGGQTWNPSFSADPRSEHNLIWTLYIAELCKTGSFKKSDLPIYRNTFLVLAHLALYAPSGPYFANLRKEDSQWYDIHPGWRFLRAVPASRSIGYVDDIQKDGLNYADAICVRCGWPTVREMLEYGSNLTHSSDFSKYIQHSSDVQLYVQQPQPQHDEAEKRIKSFLKIHGPLIWNDQSREFRMHFETDMDIYSFISEVMISEWCWTVMKVGVPIYSNLQSHRLRFFPFLGGSISDESFFESLYHNNSWLSPEHYCEY